MKDVLTCQLCSYRHKGVSRIGPLALYCLIAKSDLHGTKMNLKTNNNNENRKIAKSRSKGNKHQKFTNSTKNVQSYSQETKLNKQNEKLNYVTD